MPVSTRRAAGTPTRASKVTQSHIGIFVDERIDAQPQSMKSGFGRNLPVRKNSSRNNWGSRLKRLRCHTAATTNMSARLQRKPATKPSLRWRGRKLPMQRLSIVSEGISLIQANQRSSQKLFDLAVPRMIV